MIFEFLHLKIVVSVTNATISLISFSLSFVYEQIFEVRRYVDKYLICAQCTPPIKFTTFVKESAGKINSFSSKHEDF